MVQIYSSEELLAISRQSYLKRRNELKQLLDSFYHPSSIETCELTAERESEITQKIIQLTLRIKQVEKMTEELNGQLPGEEFYNKLNRL